MSGRKVSCQSSCGVFLDGPGWRFERSSSLSLLLEPAVTFGFPWSDVTEERRLVAEEGSFSKKTW